MPNFLFGDMIACYGNWKPAFSKSRIFFLKRWIPIFTNQIFGTLGLDCIYLHLVLFMHHFMSLLQKKNCMCSSLSFFQWTIITTYVGAAVLLLFSTILAKHFFFVTTCCTKQAFVEVFGSLMMCHKDSLQAVSWMAVTWGGLHTSTVVLRLLGAWSSYRSWESLPSKLRGTLALYFWEPNTSSPTKCGS